MNEKLPCIYIMANKKNGTIYTGVTSDLRKRVWEHKNGTFKGFTDKYKIHTLVYFEVYDTMASAIEKEKQIKAGSRKNKLALIEKDNLGWRDLSGDL